MDDYGLGVLSGLFVEVSVRVFTVLSPDCGLVVGCGVSQAATVIRPITPKAKRIFFIIESLVLPMILCKPCSITLPPGFTGRGNRFKLPYY